MRSKIILSLAAILIFLPYTARAAGKAYPSNGNDTAKPIAGINSSGDQVVLKLSTDGSIVSASQDATNGYVTVSASGPTDRTSGPSASVTGCTFVAHPSNLSTIYIGGSLVTNSSGANIGVPMSAGSALSDFVTTNLNKIYFSADNAGDKVIFICN